MEHLSIVKFLESFFNLFNAKIEDYKVVDKKIFGIVGWINEDEKQDFLFEENLEDSLFSTLKILCDFISDNKLIEGDKIVVSENELMQKLINIKWEEAEAKNAINCLCELEVKMLDEGVETDSFFVHF